MNCSNTIDKGVSDLEASQDISHPRFAAFYTWMTARPRVWQWEDPLRRETVGQVQGIVLEVGTGRGQNFPFYDVRPGHKYLKDVLLYSYR